jgi:hypothetical protein
MTLNEPDLNKKDTLKNTEGLSAPLALLKASERGAI